MNGKERDFFKGQKPITAQKLEFFREYTINYIYILLMQFGYVTILDLFCGPGYNGEKEGSPLILLNIIEEVLNDKTLKSKHPNVYVNIVFNDENPDNIIKLTKSIDTSNPNFNFFIYNEDFDNVISHITGDIKDFINTPKYFFLDPFSYSSVTIEQLKVLYLLPFSEILLFCPIMDIYRFSSAKNIKLNDEHKTRIFIDSFSIRGCDEYYDVYDLIDSIKEKLKQTLPKSFINCLLLDGGSRKNALFHITRHIKGANLFIRLSRKFGDFGQGINVKERETTKNQQALFADNKQERFLQINYGFDKYLIDRLKYGKMSNVDIIHFITENGVLPEEAKNIINTYKKKNSEKFKISYTKKKTKGLYLGINNWDNILCHIWIEEGI